MLPASLISPGAGLLDYGNLVKRSAPLNRGQTLWYKPLPLVRGGTDLMGRADMSLNLTGRGAPGEARSTDIFGTEVGNTGFGSLFNSITSLSVFGWLHHISVVNTNQYAFGGIDNEGGHSTFRLGLTGGFSQHLDAVIGGASESGGASATLTNGITANEWFYAGFTWTSNGDITLYKNGRAVANSATTITTFNVSNRPFKFRYGDTSGNAWEDYVGGIRVYINKCLTASEAFRLYEEERTGCPTTLNRSRRFFNVGFGRAGGNNFTLALDPGSYTLTGVTTSLEKGSEVQGDVGSYTYTGTTASLEFGPKVAVTPGSYALTGQNVTLIDSGAAASSGLVPWLTPGQRVLRNPVNPNAPLNRKLRFWLPSYPAGRGPNVNWLDISTYKSHFSHYTNPPTVSSDAPPGSRSSLKFDGSSSTLVGTVSGGVVTTSTFTLSCWFKPDSQTTSSGTIITDGQGASGVSLFYKGSNAGADAGKLDFQHSSSAHLSTGTLTDGQWNHIALTNNNSGNAIFYINGVAAGTVAPGSNVFTTIGAATLKGYLTDLRFQQVDLSAEDVRRLYHASRNSYQHEYAWIARRNLFAGGAAQQITLNADPGSYTYTGVTTNLEWGHKVPGDVGSYTYTGVTTSLEKGYEVQGDVGSYTYTGVAATFARTQKLLMQVGTYTLSGSDVSLFINEGLVSGGVVPWLTPGQRILNYGNLVNRQAPLNRNMVKWCLFPPNPRNSPHLWQDANPSQRNPYQATAVTQEPVISGDAPPGHYGSYLFDGINDSLEAANPGPLAISGWTASMWIKPNTQTAERGCLISNNNSASLVGFFYHGSSSANPGKIEYHVTGTSIFINHTFTNNAWSHITFAQRGDTNSLAVYVNGSLVDTLTTATFWTPFVLGGDPTSSFFFKGRIAEFRNVAYCLSADEARRLYHASRSGYQQELNWIARRNFFAGPTSQNIIFHIDIPGVYAFTGTAASLEFGPALDLAVGSYVITGTAANFRRDWEIQAAVGSYTITGTAATLSAPANPALNLDSGSYTYTGTALSPEKGWEIDTDVGSYTYTGTATNLEIGYDFNLDVGSYLLTGTTTSLEKGNDLDLAVGSYLITGISVTLVEHNNIRMGADPGSYTYTGTTTNFFYSRELQLDAEGSSYVMTGVDARFTVGREIATAVGSYAYTGVASSLEKGYAITLATGSYIVSGQAIDMVYDGVTYVLATMFFSAPNALLDFTAPISTLDFTAPGP